jgi:hypothetical protein
MVIAEHAALVQRAQDVLQRNRRESWTCPSVKLYPHQWLWDSCFTAIGIAHYDAPRAANELRGLLRGQWTNGMVPHMIFAAGSHDVGSRTIWQSHRHDGAPRGVETSCITQPPVLAVAIERVADALEATERRAFVDDVVTQLVAYHTWLYRERDPSRTGLVTLIHPWECGLDTAPPWMHALRRMRMPWWLRVAERAHLARPLRALRYDTRHLPAGERASDDDGLRMLALAVQLKEYGFDPARLPRDDRTVLVEDVGFNAMLVVANRALERIAPPGLLSAGLVECFRRTERALEDLWDDDARTYRSRNATTLETLVEPSIASLLPLWAGAAQSDALVDALRTDSYWPAFPVPSVPVGAESFQATRYWKGPTWVNTNWMLNEGLRGAGEQAVAGDLCRRTLQLVEQSGFAEYFSPLDGSGHGAPEFSWTAALAIDLVHQM